MSDVNIDTGCNVEVRANGNDLGLFYFDCDKAQYLDSELSNTSSSSVYLYSLKKMPYNSNSPYIVITSFGTPRLINGSTSQYLYNVGTTFDFLSLSYSYKHVLDMGLLFFLMLFVIINLLRGAKS